MTTLNDSLRALAGMFVLAGLALAYWVNPAWLWLDALVGLNLLQSAFTKWCPAMAVLRALGVPDRCVTCEAPAHAGHGQAAPAKA